MQRNPSISIVMATYNGEKYLSEQLASIEEQTLKPSELIVSDDGSTDHTKEIVEKFARQASFPVVLTVNDSRQGYEKNFSTALLSARGEYIFLADQDDVWMPNKIERVLQVFATDESARVVIHDIDFCRADLSKIGLTKIERMSSKFNLMNSYVTGMATAVERSFLSLCLPVPTEKGFAHDTWIHKCAMHLQVKVIMYETLALYRRHETNATIGSNLNSLNLGEESDPVGRERSLINKIFTPTTMNRNSAQVYYDWLKSLDSEQLITLGVNPGFFYERLNYFEFCADSFNRRKSLLAEGRVKRIQQALALAFDGGYRQQGGNLSFLKDVFGP